MALYGIYGRHEIKDCPLNSSESRKIVLDIENKNKDSDVCADYKINKVIGRYHSGLEHTLVWVVRTSRPHDLEEFTIELGVARWNDLKFVPERTFADVITDVTAIHGLQEWEPGDE